MKYLLLFFIFLHSSTTFAQTVNSQEVLISSQSETNLNISSKMSIFTDKTRQMSFDDIRSQTFIKNFNDYYFFPFSDDIYWIRFDLKNTDSKATDFVLVWNNPMTEQLDFYISDSLGKKIDCTVQKLYTNNKLKKLYAELPHYEFKLAQHSSKILYIRLSNKRGFQCTLNLFTSAAFINDRYDNFAEQGIIIGLVIFRLLLVLILGFFIIKEPVFKAYSFQIILKTASFFGLQNVLGPLFTNDSAKAVILNSLGINAAIIGMCVFVLYALDFKHLPKWMRYILYLFIGLTIVINFANSIDYQWYWLKVGIWISATCTIYVLGLYSYSILKKLPVNAPYSIPFVLSIVGYFLVNIRLLTGIEIDFAFTLSLILFVAEILIFVLFLGRVYINEESEKIIVERNLDFNIEQNNRLKELDNLKNNFFTNISHEFRTPLTIIASPIQELMAKYPADSLLPIMNRNAQRLLALINQLLDISKLEAKQMKVEISEDNLALYLRTLINSFSSWAESQKISFEFTQDQLDVVAYFDKDKLEKIITNLLSNAFKFTPEGGKITVNARFSEDAKTLKLDVSDTGLGIEAIHLTRIFDRYYQVDSAKNQNYESTGIGLALVKELIGVLKGTIQVSSQKNIGTTFSIEIPVDFDTWQHEIKTQTTPAVSTAASIANIETNTLSNKQIATSIGTAGTTDSDNILLIVDDNDDIRAYLRSIFENEYQIIEAVDGKDGIQKAQQTVPNLIISDLMMPKMNGFEFCKQLKNSQATSHIPVIMLTAKANVESKIEGFEVGADDYLIKPFNSKEIRARVKNLLEKQMNLMRFFTSNNTQVVVESIKVNPLEIEFLDKTKAILEQYLQDNDFNVEQFSKVMGMSATQLRRKIKALTDQTTVEFIRDFRLKRAAELLINKSVSEVAFCVGFENLSYFSKAFQEKFGVLPSEYVAK